MTLMYHHKGCVSLILLLLLPIDSFAVYFSSCFGDVISCAQNLNNCTLGISNATAFSALRTSKGQNVTSVHAATALSYTACTAYCGTGGQQFSWPSFSQEYAAWLLPYLALISQLPFGAQRRMDNLMSVVLTLGSPTLAGYSLYMTLLNARWVNDQLFAGIDYPSATVRRSVVRVLSSLQQVPLRVHPGEHGSLESLIIHPDNDSWWTMLADELDFTQGWSIASATSIIWVVVAYLLTVTNSISNVSENIENNGQGTGFGLLWLLIIVVGWLVLSPKCDYNRVHDAYHKANRQAFIANSDDPGAAPIQVTSNFGLSISPSPDWLDVTDITSPDELRIPPVFNYSRTFLWYRNVYLVSLFYRSAWRKSRSRIGVDGTAIPGNVRDDVPRASRLGTCEQIIQYCQPGDGEYSGADVLWPRGLFSNMTVASLMSLQLQWGTTFAALLANWFTPTVGLGCRSLIYLIYGTLSTMVWILLVASSLLEYYADHLLYDQDSLDLEDKDCTPDVPSILTVGSGGPCVAAGQGDLAVPLFTTQVPNGHAEGRNTLLDPNAIAHVNAAHTRRRTRLVRRRMMSRIADWLRWIGKSLALSNAIGIIANSVFQYAGVYTNCLCDSDLFTWGALAFNVINPDSSDIDLTRRSWIGALVLSLGSCSFFVVSIYLVQDTLPS